MAKVTLSGGSLEDKAEPEKGQWNYKGQDAERGKLMGATYQDKRRKLRRGLSFKVINQYGEHDHPHRKARGQGQPDEHVESGKPSPITQFNFCVIVHDQREFSGRNESYQKPVWFSPCYFQLVFGHQLLAKSWIIAHNKPMSLTLEQLVAEGKQLPPDQLAHLVDELTVQLHGGLDPAIEENWRVEVRRRLDDIQSGREPGIPHEEVSARIRKIVGL